MKWPLREKHNYILLAIFLCGALVETILFIFYPEYQIIARNNIVEEEHKGEDLICGDESIEPLMQLFLKQQNNSLQNLNTSGKFVVYWAPGGTGFGNRIPGFVSAAILALITGRGFLVHWTANPITSNTENETMFMVPFLDLFDPPFTIDSTITGNFDKIMHTDRSVVFDVTDDLFADFLLCNDIIDFYDHKQFIVFHGNRGFIDLVLHNYFYIPKIKQLGITPTYVKRIGRCLLSPTKSILNIIHDFWISHPISPSQKIIGAHIRAKSNHSVPAYEQQYLWNNILKKYPPPDLGTPFLEAEFIYFLASDSYSTLRNVPAEIVPYLIYQNASELTRTTLEGLQHAFVDIYLLGQSVEVFYEPKTTFVRATHILFESIITRRKMKKYTTLEELPCFVDYDLHPNINFTCRDTVTWQIC